MIIRPQWYDDVGDDGPADSSSSDLVTFTHSDMPIFHQFRLIISDQLRNRKRSVLNHPDPNNAGTSGCISSASHRGCVQPEPDRGCGVQRSIPSHAPPLPCLGPYPVLGQRTWPISWQSSWLLKMRDKAE
jgi:hypothetical protein